MSARSLLLALLVLLGAAVLTNSAYQHRQNLRVVSERVDGIERFVDVGVTLAMVVADPNGLEFVSGKPKLRVIERLHLGCRVDTKARPPELHAGSGSWWTEDDKQLPPDGKRVWFLSPDQWAAVLHDDDSKLGQLVYGSEGAGKTRALAMWHYVRWLECLDEPRRPDDERREGGQTAPTSERLDFVRKEMFSLYPGDWFNYVSSEDRFIMCDGTSIKLVSTYRQSKAQGSPIQGFNWSWCGRDEAQDQVDVHEDIESRGRSARIDLETGVVLYKQLATATAKDASDWRELRDVLLDSGFWEKRALSIFRSPFIGPDFIAKKSKSISPREFLRRYGDPKTHEVGDLPPELAVYYEWLRDRNIVPWPQIAKDVTASVFRDYRSYMRPGTAFGLGLGHDPGAIYNTTEIARLLMFATPIGVVPTWVVSGEFQTKQTTQRQHARQLKEYLRDEFYVGHPTVGGPWPIVFCDPHGKGEAQSDYQSVYMAFQAEGLDVFNPAPMTGRIKRSARIEMMNRLLGGTASAKGVPRLVVAQKQGKPVAPKLIEALETLKKRPGDDNPEGTQRKDEDDKTHAPAALAYLLWPFEQEAFTEATVKKALT